MKKNTYKEIEKNLNSSIKMKLNQLRTFLDLGKASVMVGAGFSKNAKMGEDIHMKDWGELCEDFIQPYMVQDQATTISVLNRPSGLLSKLKVPKAEPLLTK